ncbi:hypothetical protein BB558_005505 [Smittium angustum]|uniref:Cyclin n=1 Tax=Smittium angustum TaxID=133377 RepID=A0A2U1J084_SMIAN|nr:hypothetical protein BB558_005505 [Smittium angustum]
MKGMDNKSIDGKTTVKENLRRLARYLDRTTNLNALIKSQIDEKDNKINCEKSSTSKEVNVRRETVFHSRQIPEIGILEYLERINKYCPLENTILYAIYIYLERLKNINKNPVFEKATINNENNQNKTGVSEDMLITGFEGGDSTLVEDLDRKIREEKVNEVDVNIDEDLGLSCKLEGSGGGYVEAHSIHRLVITAVVVSSKLYSDVFYTNTRYAKVGGLSIRELNGLELYFLGLFDYNMFISSTEFALVRETFISL